MGISFSKSPSKNSEMDTVAGRLFAIEKCIRAIIPKIDSATDKWKLLLTASRAVTSELNEVYEKHAPEHKTVDSSFRSLEAFQSFINQFDSENTVTTHCTNVLKSYAAEITNLKPALKNIKKREEKYESLKRKCENIRGDTPKKHRLEERLKEAEEAYEKSSTALLQKMNELYLKHSQVLEHALIGLWHSDLRHAEAVIDTGYLMRKAVDSFLDKVASREMDKINTTWLKEKTNGYPSNATPSKSSAVKRNQNSQKQSKVKIGEEPFMEGSTISTMDSRQNGARHSLEEISKADNHRSDHLLAVA
eukprot:jgi/Galph1/5120/GphlegSOOS_G3745.1